MSDLVVMGRRTGKTQLVVDRAIADTGLVVVAATGGTAEELRRRGVPRSQILVPAEPGRQLAGLRQDVVVDNADLLRWNAWMELRSHVERRGLDLFATATEDPWCAQRRKLYGEWADPLKNAQAHPALRPKRGHDVHDALWYGMQQMGCLGQQIYCHEEFTTRVDLWRVTWYDRESGQHEVRLPMPDEVMRRNRDWAQWLVHKILDAVRKRVDYVELTHEMDPVRLAVEEVGFGKADVVNARLTREGQTMMLDVQVRDTDWEPGFEFTLDELATIRDRWEGNNLPQTDGMEILANIDRREIARGARARLDVML